MAWRGARMRSVRRFRSRLGFSLTAAAALCPPRPSPGFIGVALAIVAFAGQAQASEGGVSFYPLGIGVPDAALMPPVVGAYYSNVPYFYQGSASAAKDFEIGGNVVTGVHANIFGDFNFAEWVPTTNFFGATAAVGVVLVPGHVGASVGAILTGPLGRVVGVSVDQSNTQLADPILSGELGWKWGDQHLAITQWLNVPVGEYQDHSIANLSFHAWIGDSSLSYTWQDKKDGWQVSAKAGYTFNGINQFTDYRSGIASHYEASAEKIVSPAISVGVQTYYYWQLTGDSGSGNRIGPFAGRVVGVGGTLAYNFKAFDRPSTLRFRGMTELDAKNRLEGHSVWLVWSLPLLMKLPPTPPGAAHP